MFSTYTSAFVFQWYAVRMETVHLDAANSIHFPINLEQQSLYYIEFLKSVENNPAFKKPEVLKYAIYRYEKFWLPLSAEHQGKLSAPLDIEWIWHCHMLSPKTYAKDCHNIVGTIVDHTLK